MSFPAVEGQLFHFLLFYAKIGNMNIINIKDTSNKLYYVGGVVRDELLGVESFDVDIVYEGDAIEFAKGLEQTAASFEILQINEPFGTVRVKFDGHETDIASTRAEIYERKGHLPSVTKVGCSLKDDVKRRDFTINSLYKSVSTGEVFDFTGGLEDLKNKKIRVLHDESFVDDPTRILRALKFSVRFGFELDEHTKKLQDNYLKNINYDMCYKRIKKELMETFNLNSQAAFETFINDGIYKLVTKRDITLPQVNIEAFVSSVIAGFDPQSHSQRINNLWLVYAGVLGDLSRLPLTAKEQKILDDFNSTGKLHNDLEIYKAFEKAAPETVLLYAVLKDKTAAMRYFDKLCHIKILINGEDLINLGLRPSKKFNEIFDYVLEKKLENPHLTKQDELNLVRGII